MLFQVSSIDECLPICLFFIDSDICLRVPKWGANNRVKSLHSTAELGEPGRSFSFRYHLFSSKAGIWNLAAKIIFEPLIKRSGRNYKRLSPF